MSLSFTSSLPCRPLASNRCVRPSHCKFTRQGSFAKYVNRASRVAVTRALANSGESRDKNLSTLTNDMRMVLKANTYYPNNKAKYPYFLVQMNEDGELPYGDNGLYVSDCIAAYLASVPTSDVLLQTHGWDTSTQKAIEVPFAEFMGGMQNDAAMPTEGFEPVFVAVAWPGQPMNFEKSEDALQRAELLVKSERSHNNGKDTDISRAAMAAKVAVEKGDENDSEYEDSIKALASNAVADDDDDDDDGDDDDVAKVKAGKVDDVVVRARETPLTHVAEVSLSTFRYVLRPLEHLVFGRLMKRGRNVGLDMARIVGKLMTASSRQGDGKGKRTRFSVMANSLGAQCVVGMLKRSNEMPYKLHSVLFIQGAIASKWFRPGRKYAGFKDKVAGPFVATYSKLDTMLKIVFTPFHGEAVGFGGFPQGRRVDMKSLGQLKESEYQFDKDSFTSVNGVMYINEGSGILGSHGDFKEDETTSVYWSMIKTQLEDSAYEK